MEYLPLFPPAIRDQALRLLVQLSEHGRSGETTRASERVITSISPEKHIRVPKPNQREEATTGTI